MYSFYEIKEMEKAKAETIRRTSSKYPKKKQNSTPTQESVQERSGIIHYRGLSLITKIARYGYFSLFRLPRSGMAKTI